MPKQVPLRQVARIAQFAPVIASTVFQRPHRRHPHNQATSLESQPTPPYQHVRGQTLRLLVPLRQSWEPTTRCPSCASSKLARTASRSVPAVTATSERRPAARPAVSPLLPPPSAALPPRTTRSTTGSSSPSGTTKPP